MALSKIQSESLNLADNFAFTGTITGAGSEGFIHLETQETTSAVASVKFGPDVFNTTYDRYHIIGRAMPDTDGASLYYRFMNSSEADLTATNSYRYTQNGNTNTNDTKGRLTSSIGNVHVIESGVLFTMDLWLPHVGNNNYYTMGIATAHRVNTGNNSAYDYSTHMFRYDQDSTQPVGMNFFFDSGNFAKVTISVLAVSGA